MLQTKKTNIIIIFLLIVLLSGCDKENNIKYTNNIDNNILYNIGYNEKQINMIYKYLDLSDISYLTNLNYIENIEDYLGYDIMDIKNIDRYKSFRNKHDNLDLYHIILYVNMNLDKPFYSEYNTVDNPNSNLVLINKYNKLPDDYAPNDLELLDSSCTVKEDLYLRKEARDSFYNMCMDMKSLNLDIKAISGYRTQDYQKMLYEEYSSKDGEEKAIKYSAKPRFSEHETGLSVDVMGSNKNYLLFKDTYEFQYIKEHAFKYGFIIRYENEFVTGYIDEEWHLRYVGVDAATKIKEENISLEEYIYLLNN